MLKKFDYMIDFYLSVRKLEIEVDELCHFDRGEITENRRQKELEEYLGCTFIRIHPNEKDFSAYDGLGKIQTFIDTLKDEELKKLKDKIKKLKKDKESIIEKISKSLLQLKFKEDNSIRTKCLKWIVKK